MNVRQLRRAVTALLSAGALLLPLSVTTATTAAAAPVTAPGTASTSAPAPRTTPAGPAVRTAPVTAPVPAAAGTVRHDAACSADFFGQDPRLGPRLLPDTGPVGRQLAGYRRTGGMAVAAFLARYYDPAANSGSGGWSYPPAGGYVTLPGGTPLEWRRTLLPGEDIDRYGSEYGAYLAPEGLPYAERALPPQSLDGVPAAGCNYHDYRVLRPFTVESGPIASWFAQPGGGLQYQLVAAAVPGAPAVGYNVGWLVANGYLERLI